jgi:hypothetical protein
MGRQADVTILREGRPCVMQQQVVAIATPKNRACVIVMSS